VVGGEELGMPGMKGYLLNPAGQHDWPRLIGCFVINFGAIEVQTYEWLRKLSADGLHLEQALKKLFNDRVRILRQLLGELKLPSPLNVECEEVWNQATDLAAFRNTIAHSPIVLVWKNHATAHPMIRECRLAQSAIDPGVTRMARSA
jgi:hypothetical protein